jgi:hypothetical protein
VKEGATREAASEHSQRDANPAPGADNLDARVLELQRSAGNAAVGCYLLELHRQPAAAPAATQWGPAYGTRKSYFGHSYETYKAAIPELTPASKTAGTARTGGRAGGEEERQDIRRDGGRECLDDGRTHRPAGDEEGGCMGPGAGGAGRKLTPAW